jgi:hypothetical protein
MGTALNLRGPRRFDFRRIVGCGIIQTGQEFRRKVSSLPDG